MPCNGPVFSSTAANMFCCGVPTDISSSRSRAVRYEFVAPSENTIPPSGTLYWRTLDRVVHSGGYSRDREQLTSRSYPPLRYVSRRRSCQSEQNTLAVTSIR